MEWETCVGNDLYNLATEYNAELNWNNITEWCFKISEEDIPLGLIWADFNETYKLITINQFEVFIKNKGSGGKIIQEFIKEFSSDIQFKKWEIRLNPISEKAKKFWCNQNFLVESIGDIYECVYRVK